MEIKEEISHLSHRRSRNYPLGLVVDASGAASAVGKLTSHCLREAPACRADHLIYDRQSAEARTGSGGNGGNVAV